jgi:2-keto-4-pentenoate hydratase/2-oxohepta-3-ene-1,7-dioic acid hydratase in catechol pathway
MRLVSPLDGGLAALVGDRLVDLPWPAGAAGGGGLDALVASGPAAWDAARGAIEAAAEAATPTRAAADVPLGPPLKSPSKIVCVGLNYEDHTAETKLERPERPLLFSKFASCLIGPEQDIHWPAGLTEQVDWEAELAVVIGRTLRSADQTEAMDAVFGYSVANDVSARDLQFSDGQWMRGKSLDSFCPLGPAIVTADEVPDPQALRISARVNGETMQDASTADMIFPVAEILSYCSHSFALQPGDLILTGTPAGVGAFRNPPIHLKPGDRVEVEVETIGTLANPVRGSG